MKVSLGLLPSGPDPVGEEHVRANLLRPYIGHDGGNRKGRGATPAEGALAAAGAPFWADQGLTAGTPVLPVWVGSMALSGTA